MKRRTVFLATLCLAACGDSGPLESIRVDGTVTAGGQPAEAGRASLIDAFGVSVTTSDIENGSFVLEAEISPETCTPSTGVSIVARDGNGDLVGIDTEELPGCGTHTVAFTF